jgi:predicted phosphate transport protein (TIGR00153 family)
VNNRKTGGSHSAVQPFEGPSVFPDDAGHRGNIAEAAELFRENMETLADKVTYAERIKDLETKGDEFTHQLIQELNKTFVTPLDHEDFLKLVFNLDDVLDGIEACAARFVYLHVEQSNPRFVKYAELLQEAAKNLQEAFFALEKRNYEAVRKASMEIQRLESEGDKLTREAIGKLFEEKTDPIDLIRMKEIYEKLESVIDRFEDVMDVMESVVMKYA